MKTVTTDKEVGGRPTWVSSRARSVCLDLFFAHCRSPWLRQLQTITCTSVSHCLAARPGLWRHDTVQRLTVYVEALSRAGRGANGFLRKRSRIGWKAWELLRRRLAKTASSLTSCTSRCWERLLHTEITWCRKLGNDADGVASIRVYCCV